MVDRNQEIFQFDVEGNFEQELENLRQGIKAARRGFANLKAEMQSSGAAFRQSKEAIKAAARGNEELEKTLSAVNQQLPKRAQVANAARVEAQAYNALANEANRLAVARVAESRALEQARRNSDPKIIQARAETRALRALTRQLEEEAAKREFRNLAAKNGLTVSADGRKLFNLEAVAAERAAKAIERVGVAEATRKNLAAQGRDETGRRFLVSDGKLTEEGKAAAAKTAERKLQAALLAAEEASILKTNKAYRDAKSAAKLARDEIAGLTSEGEKTDRTFNRVSFTFRRLIGIFAVLTAVRTAVSGFRNLVTGAIELNAQLETARVGMAGLIAAAGEVRGPRAERLGLDEQVLRAQDIAIDQMNKLRRDALTTAASYDELSRAFQSAIAPGIQAGLGLDEIRKVTVDISQAATGLGLAQDQLAEEIRSLFQGTITPRNTRIATALGISNEDIRRARELGTLFEFLQTRFAAISKTGKLLLNTFTGQLSNAADAFKQLLATSSEPLFEQLKAGLKEIQDAIFSTTESAVVFDPGTLAAFRGLFEGLAQGVRGIRTAFAQIDIKGFAATLSTIGSVIGTIATALANTFTTFFNIASPTFNIIGGIVKLFSQIATAINQSTGPLSDFVKTLTSSAAKGLLLLFVFGKLIVGIRSAAKAAFALFTIQKITEVTTGNIVTKVGLLRKALTGLVALLGRFAPYLLIITAAIAGIDSVLAAFGSKTRIADLIADAFNGLTGVLDDAFSKVLGIKEELNKPFDTSIGDVKNDFRELISSLGEISEKAKQTGIDLDNAFKIQQLTQGLPALPAQIISVSLDKMRELFSTDELKKLQAEILNTSALLQAKNKELLKFQDFASRVDPGLSQQLVENEARLKLNKDRIAEINSEISKLQFNEPGAGFKNAALGLEKVKAEEAVNMLLSERSRLEDKMVKLSSDGTTLVSQQLALQEKLNALKDQEASQVSQRNKEIAKEITRLADQDLFETSLRLPELGDSLQEAENAVDAFRTLSVVEAAFFEKNAASARVITAALREEKELNLAIGRLEEKREELKKQGSVESETAVLGLNALITKRKEELVLVQAKNERLREEARLQEELAELRVSGTSTQGLKFGLEQFAKENASSFNIGEKFGRDLANGITEFGGQAISEIVVSAFDPSRNFDLRQSLGNLALSLGQGLLTDFLKQGLSSLIQALGINLSNSLSGAARAGASLTGGATAVQTAFLTGETVMEATTTAMVSAINTAAIAALSAIAAAQSGQTVAGAASVVGAAGGALAQGGSVDTTKRIAMPNLGITHRNARGFAAGGRPRGVDARDTIPAWLRPGEWVIRPEAVRLYGDKLFDMLNRRRLNPEALRLSGGPRTLPTPKSGFATGGRVVASSKSATPLSVNTVQFFDEQTLDRALAAGPESLPRFSRRRRGGMRAALGIDQAP